MIDWNGIKIVETDCMLPIDRVKPYARNAKRHPQEQIDEIKASIKRFGMDDPIGIWGKENLIVEGHGRLEACKQLGIPTVPCIRLDHLTKEERKAYTLAHNKTNMDSGWGSKKTFSWCFDGEPTNAPVIVSSVGTQKNPESAKAFLDGYNTMLERLSPTVILLCGKKPKECTGNIVEIAPFYDSVVRRRKNVSV